MSQRALGLMPVESSLAQSYTIILRKQLGEQIAPTSQQVILAPDCLKLESQCDADTLIWGDSNCL